MFNKQTIEKYADNLLIGLSDEEVNTLLEEFDVIKNHMDIISDIKDLDKVEPLCFVQDINTFDIRSGEDIQNISTSDALKNCSDVIEDVVSVPKVVG